METIMRKFSSVVFTERAGWLEVLYDDAIRVTMALGSPIAVPDAGSPLGEQAPGSLRLAGAGLTSMSCTSPECIRGVPPVKKPPDLVPFSVDLQATDFEVIDGEWPCLVISASTGRIAIPIFDAALDPDDLCKAMTKYRNPDMRVPCQHEAPCMGFHVYLISAAPAPLEALQNKHIALPIPSEIVAAVDDVCLKSA
jgi:hypothetical protein